MVDYIPSEKATSIRYPSTANLMISSYDRTAGSSADNFSISKNASILNGFFTRISTAEVCLNWTHFNIFTGQNKVVNIDISGVGVQTVTLPDGCYTCADALDTFVALFNGSTGGGRSLAVTSTGMIVTLTMTGGAFRFPLVNNDLIGNLNFGLAGAYGTTRTAYTSGVAGSAPAELLQPIRYLDFVSPQLTYNQELKDASTAPIVRDVLCRWYMNFTDDVNQVDKYGYAIVMGMKPFYVRRIFSPPKQIKWSNAQPIGQLSFEVYDSNGNAFSSNEFDWLMTLQVSEV